MLSLSIPLLIGIMVSQDAGSAPTAAELERAHNLLNGSWRVVSMLDDGDMIAESLIRSKLAANGCIRVANRSIEVVNPETGEKRTNAFRIDPSKLPRQIDVITRDDRIQEGIYRIDGEELIVCLQQRAQGSRPIDFEAPAGSGCLLLRLKADNTQPSPPAEAAPTKPADAAVKPVETPAKVATDVDRKPTESELKRVHELLSGYWDIMGITDDGEELGPELIRRRFAENGRVQFGSRSMAVVDPKSEERRITAYRIDPTKFPSQIDVISQLDTVLKGIYRFEGEKLLICVAKHEDGARPTTFEAPGGSDRSLFQLQLSKPDPAPPAQPAPAPALRPSPEEETRRREDLIRRMMVGSWKLTDTKGTLTMAFKSDGTFSGTRVWSKSAKDLFGSASDTSNGSWRFADSWLTVYVTSTTNKALAGHRMSVRVQTISDASMVISDQWGTVNTAAKVR